MFNYASVWYLNGRTLLSILSPSIRTAFMSYIYPLFQNLLFQKTSLCVSLLGFVSLGFIIIIFFSPPNSLHRHQTCVNSCFYLAAESRLLFSSRWRFFLSPYREEERASPDSVCLSICLLLCLGDKWIFVFAYFPEQNELKVFPPVPFCRKITFRSETIRELWIGGKFCLSLLRNWKIITLCFGVLFFCRGGKWRR